MLVSENSCYTLIYKPTPCFTSLTSCCHRHQGTQQAVVEQYYVPLRMHVVITDTSTWGKAQMDRHILKVCSWATVGSCFITFTAISFSTTFPLSCLLCLLVFMMPFLPTHSHCQVKNDKMQICTFNRTKCEKYPLSVAYSTLKLHSTCCVAAVKLTMR